MKLSIKICQLLFLFLCFYSSLDVALAAEEEDNKIQMLFSKPGFRAGQDFGSRDRCGPTLNRKISSIAASTNIRRASIHVAMYTLTSPGLIRALTEFSNNGGKVCIIVDNQQLYNIFGTGTVAKKDMEEKLKRLRDETGNNVKLGILGNKVSPFQTLHEKFAIIDNGSGKTELILGSYNWTTNASHNNYENCVVIPRGQEEAIDQTKVHFDELWNLSGVYGGGTRDQTCLFTPTVEDDTGVPLPAVAAARPAPSTSAKPSQSTSSVPGRRERTTTGVASQAPDALPKGVGRFGRQEAASLKSEPIAAPLVDKPKLGKDIGALPAGFSPTMTRDQRKELGRPLGSPGGTRGTKVRQQLGKTIGLKPFVTE